jgi:hypothetical protein
MRHRYAVTILATLLLGACATPQWHRPGMTPEQFAQDDQECDAIVAQMYPAKPTGGSPLAYETDCATYGHQNSCATGPGVLMATPSRLTAKNKAKQECLQARGYVR